MNVFYSKLGKILYKRHWEGSGFGIGKGPVAKLGKTGTDWEWSVYRTRLKKEKNAES